MQQQLSRVNKDGTEIRRLLLLSLSLYVYIQASGARKNAAYTLPCISGLLLSGWKHKDLSAFSLPGIMARERRQIFHKREITLSASANEWNKNISRVTHIIKASSI